MIQQTFNAMITFLLARFMLNDVPHAAGLLGNPTPLGEATRFVSGKLGVSLNPTLEYESQPRAKYVAIRIPGQEKIVANPQYFPKDKAGQRTVLIHEVSEIGYEKKGFEQPHTQASSFTSSYWRQIGGKDPAAIHKELVGKGYYYGSESALNIERMLSGEYYNKDAG